MTETIAWIEAHDALAAWVQAFGAILALSISVWATIHATNAAKRMATRQHEMFIVLIEQIATDVQLWVGGSPIETRREVQYRVAGGVSEVRDMVDRLFETPMAQWPNAALFQSARRLAGVLNDLATAAVKVTAGASEDLQSWELEEAATAHRPQFVVRYQLYRLAKEIDRLMLGCWRTRRAFRLSYKRTWRKPFNHGAMDHFIAVVGQDWSKARLVERPKRVA